MSGKISSKGIRHHCEFLQPVLLVCILTSLQNNSRPQSNSQHELVILAHLLSREGRGCSFPYRRHEDASERPIPKTLTLSRASGGCYCA